MYDVKHDCTHPQLDASTTLPDGKGHEGDFAPDGKTFVTGSLDNVLRLRDLQTGIILRQFVHPSAVTSAEKVSPAGLATLSASSVGVHLVVWAA